MNTPDWLAGGTPPLAPDSPLGPDGVGRDFAITSHVAGIIRVGTLMSYCPQFICVQRWGREHEGRLHLPTEDIRWVRLLGPHSPTDARHVCERQAAGKPAAFFYESGELS